MRSLKKQQGAALIIALILLIVITILALNGMTGGIMEMRMSGNEETRSATVHQGQGAADVVAARIICKDGYTTNCLSQSALFTGGPGSTVMSTAMSGTSNISFTSYPSLTATSITAIIKRLYPESGIPNATRISGRESSVRVLQAAFFQIETTYDNTANGGGKAKIVQGFTATIPKAQ